MTTRDNIAQAELAQAWLEAISGVGMQTRAVEAAQRAVEAMTIKAAKYEALWAGVQADLAEAERNLEAEQATLAATRETLTGAQAAAGEAGVSQPAEPGPPTFVNG